MPSATNGGTMQDEPFPRHETWARLWLKTMEWRLTGILLGAFIGYALTGSWKLGALFGGIYNVVRLVVMPFRDRLWNRVRWGTSKPERPDS